MPQFMAGRRRLDTLNMIISNSKVIEKNETSINLFHPKQTEGIQL